MWLSNQVLAPGEWNHLALVRSGENVTLYMNGLPDSGVQFSASLYPYANWACVGPIWQYFGTEPVVVDELLIAATAALPPAGEPEAPSGIYASLYIPESLTAGACDVVRYFHGLRDAGPTDPAFAEAEGEPASLVFRGAFQGVETTIALDPATFPGLTENVDSFEATMTFTYPNGATMTVVGSFTESGGESGIFRGALPSLGQDTGPGGEPRWRQWCDPSLENRVGNMVPNYFPFVPRVRGLPSNACETGYRTDVLGHDCELEWRSDDGCFYLRSQSPLVGVYLSSTLGEFSLAFQGAQGPFRKEGHFRPGLPMPRLEIKEGQKPPVASADWPKGVEVRVSLTGDPHWHNREAKDGRPWFFSGPAYTAPSSFKFLVETAGYRRLNPVGVHILDNANTRCYYMRLFPGEAGSSCFTGSWTEQGMKRYLHPKRGPFRLFVTLEPPARGTPVLWGAEFDVRSRYVYWYDANPAPNDNTFFHVGHHIYARGDLPAALRAGEPSHDPYSGAPLLICNGEWSDAYSWLTVAGTMYSGDHGGPISNPDGTASYGGIELGAQAYSGFVPGVFHGYEAQGKPGVPAAYELQPQELPDITIDLMHCFSGARSHTGWPWPERGPNGAVLQGDGRRVIDTLANIAFHGGGSGTVIGYSELATIEVALPMEIVDTGIPLGAQQRANLHEAVRRDYATPSFFAVGCGYDLSVWRRRLEVEARQWIVHNVLDGQWDGRLENLKVRASVVVTPPAAKRGAVFVRKE